MAESLVLDPSQVATNRTELDLTPWLAADGVDYGDSEIQAFTAEQARGSSPVDFRVPNRTISGGLIFAKTIGGTTPTQARAAIQSKLARIQQEGGWLRRITNSGGTVYADLVNATFRATSVPGYQSRDDIDTGAGFSLEAIPDFYGDEVELSDHTETSAAELIFTETDIAGDYPGRVRIVVDEDDAEDQRGLIWAFRSRHYSSAASAAMEYEAEELGALDTAALAALSGASGGTVVTHGTLSTSWTPVLSGRIGGTTYPTHTGSYQMFARLYSTSGTAVRARSVWDVGDLVNPTENEPVRLPGASNFYLQDLGEVRLDAAPVGTHRWDYQIQGAGDAGSENLSVDKVWIVNKDEGMGRLSAPIISTEGLVAYSARSEFTTESGAINGDSLRVGGTWTGSGDAVDFSVAAGEMTRTEVSDTTARFIVASTPTPTVSAARVDFKVSALAVTGALQPGVILRYVDVNNYLRVRADMGSASSGQVLAEVVVGGASVGATPVGSVTWESDTWYTCVLVAFASGSYCMTLAKRNGAPFYTGASNDSNLATGGVLAAGKVGIHDRYSAASPAVTRTYDNFAAWVPSPDAVLFSSQSAQLTTDGMYREDAGGTAYGPVSNVRGDLPRLPPEGLDSRTTQVFIKGSRGDLEQLPDSGLDDISARVTYRPSWLFVDD